MPCLWSPSTWPRITAGPTSPGDGPNLYQPACCGWSTGGTCTDLSALSPSWTNDERAAMLGMSTQLGGETVFAAELVAAGTPLVTTGPAEPLPPQATRPRQHASTALP